MQLRKKLNSHSEQATGVMAPEVLIMDLTRSLNSLSHASKATHVRGILSFWDSLLLSLPLFLPELFCGISVVWESNINTYVDRQVWVHILVHGVKQVLRTKNAHWMCSFFSLCMLS